MKINLLKQNITILYLLKLTIFKNKIHHLIEFKIITFNSQYYFIFPFR